MSKLTRALTELLDGNEFLRIGLYHRLLNLSQVGRFLRPQLEARSKQSLELSAITMALSRIQKELLEQQRSELTFPPIANMTVHSNLMICVLPASKDTRKQLEKLYAQAHAEASYITISEGMTEVSVITTAKYRELLDELLPQKAIYRHDSVASIAVKFHPTYIETAGVIYAMVQQLYFQSINILEIASAGTELILYLEEKDVRLAFNTIYRRMTEEKS